jgi:hypothetical protein
VYGFYHQSSITSSIKRAEADREYARQERLIEQAKAEWKKKTQPQDAKSTGGMFGLLNQQICGAIERATTGRPFLGVC